MNMTIRVMVVSACVWLATEFWFRTWGKMHEGDISLLLRMKQDPLGFANEHKVLVCVTCAQLIARPVCIGSCAFIAAQWLWNLGV